MTATRSLQMAVAMIAGSAGLLRSQDLLVPAVSPTTGVDAQSYRFGTGNAVRGIDQVAVPLGVVIPLGRRLSVDLGTSYAWTRVELDDGSTPEISSLTDTQIRLGWLLGRDAAVFTLLVNLPTGAEQVTLGEFSAASAVSTNFLPFPVHTYGTGAAVTAGAAVARPWGAWNVGLAASVRLNGAYEPFANAPDQISYRQAVEGRFQVGVDRLVGSSRLSLGATVGTFGTDQFTNGSGAVVGEYRPGTRITGEMALASLVWGGAVSTFLWGHHRWAGDDPQTGSLANQETIVAGGAQGVWRLDDRMSFQPSLEGRWWAPERGSGWLAVVGAALGIRLSTALSLVPMLRVDVGSLERVDGQRSRVEGWGGSLFLRGSF